jgi:hypothetical protein
LSTTSSPTGLKRMIASGDSQIYVVGRMPANYDSSFDKEVSKK